MANKVNLDALIRREDFAINEASSQQSKNIDTISLRDLEKGTFFFESIRKPDFQRETNEWDANKILGLIESYINGDLIPAVILWHGNGNTFVIDGSHRFGALAAWVNDDYGDGVISKEFNDGRIKDEQIEIAEKARTTIRKRIGKYSDYKLALTNPEKVAPEIVERAKSLGRLAVQLQWVIGDVSKAEESFFKINKLASPINPTELFLLKLRNAPNCIAARAIIHSGTGHKYWSRFDGQIQNNIKTISKEINDLLFVPPLKTPIKTLELPIAGKLYSAQTLPLIVNFINIVNGSKIKEYEKSKPEDATNDSGKRTIEYLQACKQVALKINSSDSGSLGLHPAVYFYSKEGTHKPVSFYAVTELILEFNRNRAFCNKFISVRNKFEEMLIEYDYLTGQILRKYRSGGKAYPHITDLYSAMITNLADGISKEDTISKLLSGDFKYLTKSQLQQSQADQEEFSTAIKSEAFLNEALDNALKCKICGGFIYSKSISIDHKTRIADGGKGTIDNAQLTHQYCNTTYKN
jgi:hypothetical protein